MNLDNLDKTDYLAIGLFIVMIGISLHGFTQIQGDITIHFNAQGQPDNTVDKLQGLLILPAVSVLTFALIRYLPKIDPLKEKTKLEPTIKGLTAFLIGFMTYIQALIVVWNLGYVFDISKAITPAVALTYYVLGVAMSKAERNWFIGLRTPWTLSSDEVWKKTHEKCSPLFKFSAVIALGALAFPGQILGFVILPVLAVSLYGTVYSYKLYREIEK
jgi:uncharacterized membrane protein